MANEFIHKEVGIVMTEAEYDNIDAHQFNSQATGDTLYASSATQLSRLGIGAANTVLHVADGIPAWSATLAGLTLTSPTINGTIATTGLTLPAVTLGGALTLNGQVFDAGAGDALINTTGASKGLLVTSTQDAGTGVYTEFYHNSASPDAGDFLSRVWARGKDSDADKVSYGAWDILIEDPTGNGTGKQQWANWVAGIYNVAMTLSGAGGLAVDLDNGGTDYYVGLFDEYDDALVIKQGIQENNRELLADIGVFDRKDTGSGYMMKIQPMVRLLAGGIYQTREMVDELAERLEIAEKKLLLIGG